MSPKRLPIVAIVGRPNVGKSSLVNRIVGHRATVVEERPGVTRDRKPLDAEWIGVHFTAMDTGGWLAGGNELDAKVSAQAELAVAEADLILFVVDASTGVTEEDLQAARVVQRASCPSLLVVNKVDDGTREAVGWEFLSLGLGDPWPVSAIHGRGTGDLLDEVVRLIPEEVETDEEGEGERVPRVAIVGRPNVGKSTMFNRLIGEDRAVVHDMPGTTVDTIDTVVETPEGVICFVDTAGLRRKGRVEEGSERYATVRALRAMEEANLALLVIDATVGATHQDQRLAERLGTTGCPTVVLLNKWELVSPEDREDVSATVADRLAFLGAAPVLKVSALSGKGVHRILPALVEALEGYQRRISTGVLNRALADIQQAHPPVGARIKYIVQGAADPPTFTIFVNGRLQQTYLRYLERGLRERLDLGATPIKIRVRLEGA